MKYDIFISYRRDDGAQYARILQLELEKRGYRVFLDYEELTDGVFGDEIKEAIRQAPIFMMILTPLYLARSMEQESWVREEIELAIAENKHFIPVDPDKKFAGVPTGTPQGIADIVSRHQHSAIDFGQALGATVDLMVKNRIATKVKPHRKPGHAILTAAIITVLLAASGLWYYWHQNNVGRTRALAAKCQKLKVEKTPWGQYLNWSNSATLEQLQAVNAIMGNMVEVRGGSFMQGAAPSANGGYDDDVDKLLDIPQTEQTVGTFWMGMYEVTAGDWHRIMQTSCAEADSLMPVTDVSYDDSQAFVLRLNELTGLEFRLPTETEWEYAARGGAEPDNTKYAGSNHADEVAWHQGNSGGKPHVCDATNSPMTCNALNLFDMSGNVSEWTSTDFRPYREDVPVTDAEAKAIRGGDYLSGTYALTVYHREPMSRSAKAETVGLRLAISVNE